MPSFRVLIGEKDGVEFEYSTEYDLAQAITELGFGRNFSYHKIITDFVLTISENQHMICTSLEIDGFLDLDGGLVFL